MWQIENDWVVTELMVVVNMANAKQPKYFQ